MNRAGLWQKIKRKVRILEPGNARRELRLRASTLGAKPAGKFADISNNNAVTAAMIHEYAENHNVIVLKASEGQTWRDPKLQEFVRAAKRAGLIVAAYHYARPDNGNSPESEARNFVYTCRAAGLRLGKRRTYWYERDELPGILDYEEYHPTGLDADWIDRFMAEYRKLTRHGIAKWKGKESAVTANCILYGGHVVREKIPHRIGALYWLAAYTKTAAPYWPRGLPKKFRLAWQFTDDGRFKAFGDQPIDRNRFVNNLKIRDLLGLAL